MLPEEFQTTEVTTDFGPPLIAKYPRLQQAVAKLGRQRRGSGRLFELLLLRKLQYFEAHGAPRDEAAPSADHLLGPAGTEVRVVAEPPIRLFDSPMPETIQMVAGRSFNTIDIDNFVTERWDVLHGRTIKPDPDGGGVPRHAQTGKAQIKLEEATDSPRPDFRQASVQGGTISSHAMTIADDSMMHSGEEMEMEPVEHSRRQLSVAASQLFDAHAESVFDSFFESGVALVASSAVTASHIQMPAAAWDDGVTDGSVEMIAAAARIDTQQLDRGDLAHGQNRRWRCLVCGGVPRGGVTVCCATVAGAAETVGHQPSSPMLSQHCKERMGAYVERAFAVCKTEGDRETVALLVQERIRAAMDSHAVETVDWDAEIPRAFGRGSSPTGSHRERARHYDHDYAESARDDDRRERGRRLDHKSLRNDYLFSSGERVKQAAAAEIKAQARARAKAAAQARTRRRPFDDRKDDRHDGRHDGRYDGRHGGESREYRGHEERGDTLLFGSSKEALEGHGLNRASRQDEQDRPLRRPRERGPDHDTGVASRGRDRSEQGRGQDRSVKRSGSWTDRAHSVDEVHSKRRRR